MKMMFLKKMENLSKGQIEMMAIKHNYKLKRKIRIRRRIMKVQMMIVPNNNFKDLLKITMIQIYKIHLKIMNN